MNYDKDEDVSEREPLNTLSMIEEGFLSQLKASTKEKIDNAETSTPIERVEKSAKATTSVKNNINTEKILTEMYDIRDEMIDSFKDVDVSSKLALTLTNSINKIGSFIKSYGGKVETFDPLDNASGLEIPDITVNAERVIDNTRRAYKLGKIEKSATSNNGKEIQIEFTGEKGEMVYRAMGTICANGSWTGSEAIDYVYTIGEGKMSVKALNNEGRWADKSSDFKISWELWEDKKNEEIENDVRTASKEEEPKEIKEEVKTIPQNNLEDEDIGDDFPIEEK